MIERSTKHCNNCKKEVKADFEKLIKTIEKENPEFYKATAIAGLVINIQGRLRRRISEKDWNETNVKNELEKMVKECINWRYNEREQGDKLEKMTKKLTNEEKRRLIEMLKAQGWK